jgi:serine/threonine-protein kinase PpkA
VLLVAAAAWVWREPLQQWRPATGFEQLLRDADRALQAGRLSAADGSGARQLYARAVALDPDDERALDGLHRVGQAAVAQAQRALDQDRPDAAREALSLARELGVAATRIEALEAALRTREQRDVQVEQLLADARRALEQDRLDGDDGALALYRRALQAIPDNEPARAGLREVLARMLRRADEQIAAGALDEAAAQIDAVAAIDPAHLQLSERRAALAEARQARSSGVAQRLEDARLLLRRGRLVAPPGDNAREAYRAVLALEPGHREALDGLRRVGEALLAQADRQLADFRFDQAQALIDEARATDPGLAGLRAAGQRLAERRAARSALTGAAPLDAAQRQARDAHLQAAAQALAAGRLVHPPGDSAFDRYKAALSIDPASQPARDGIAAIPAAARRFFDDAIGTQRLSSARGYVEGLETVAPADPALFDMKRRLARSLLGYADERLGAGEVQRARDAFEQASELDPGNPDLAAMRARLEQATR